MTNRLADGVQYTGKTQILFLHRLVTFFVTFFFGTTLETDRNFIHIQVPKIRGKIRNDNGPGGNFPCTCIYILEGCCYFLQRAPTTVSWEIYTPNMPDKINNNYLLGNIYTEQARTLLIKDKILD